MKTFSVSNLYFEFIKDSDLDGLLTAKDAALKLQKAARIKLLPDRLKPDKPLDFYQWLKTDKVPRPDFIRDVLNILKS